MFKSKRKSIKKKQLISPSDIWVLIPAYNEEKYIENVLREVLTYTDNIIVVSDGSSDATGILAGKHAPVVVEHEINLGKGAALKTGCEYAFHHLAAKAVIFLDSDLQHDPSELPRFYEALKSWDVVFGVRVFSTQMPLLRSIFNRVASVLIWLLFGYYIPDIPCGYKAMKKTAYERLAWESRDYAVETEIAARTARNKIPFKTLTVRTIYHDFDRGMTFLDTLNVLLKIASWRFSL